MSDSKDVVTAPEVAAAVEALQAAGTRVTDRAIRKQLGDRGSMNTICKFRREATERAAGTADLALPNDVESAVSASIRKSLAVAYAQLNERAQRQIEETRAATDQLVDEANRLADEALQRINDREARIQTLESELSLSRSATVEVREQLAQALARLQSAQEDIQRERNRSDQMVEQLLRLTATASEKQSQEPTGRRRGKRGSDAAS